MVFKIEEFLVKASIEIYGYFDKSISVYDYEIREKIFQYIDSLIENRPYREKYEITTSIITPEGFEIHHIDLDRDNNSIKNLVLLPKSLHRRYHSLRNKILLFRSCEIPDGFLFDTKMFNSEQIELDSYNKVELIIELSKILKICNKWVYLRDCILGLSSHNFKSLDYNYIFKNEKEFKF